jgi:ketosteroid isomerase-like protein
MFLNRTYGFLLIVFAFTLFSCSQQDKMEIEKSASAFDIKQGEASVLQSNQHFIKSYKAGDSAEVAQSFTTNAKVMVANRSPIEGRKEIMHYFSGLRNSGISDLKLNTVKIEGDSTILVEEGSYQLLNKKGVQTDKGEYLSLWQLESGNWKIYRDMWMSTVPKSVIKISDSTLSKQ